MGNFDRPSSPPQAMISLSPSLSLFFLPLWVCPCFSAHLSWHLLHLFLIVMVTIGCHHYWIQNHHGLFASFTCKQACEGWPRVSASGHAYKEFSWLAWWEWENCCLCEWHHSWAGSGTVDLEKQCWLSSGAFHSLPLGCGSSVTSCLLLPDLSIMTDCNCEWK